MTVLEILNRYRAGDATTRALLRDWWTRLKTEFDAIDRELWKQRQLEGRS